MKIPDTISKKFALLLGSLGLIGGMMATVAIQTHAASSPANAPSRAAMRGNLPAVAGTVTAASGNTLTVTDKRSGTAYTINAGSATIKSFPGSPSTGSSTVRPAPATISVSDIKVGDTVTVQGTISGTTVTATNIMDGPIGFGKPRPHGKLGTAGTVSAVSGNTATLTAKNGTSYTIDLSGAAIKKISSATVSDVKVGDALVVQGTVSGTTVTASSVLDGELPLKGVHSTPANK